MYVIIIKLFEIRSLDSLLSQRSLYLAKHCVSLYQSTGYADGRLLVHRVRVCLQRWNIRLVYVDIDYLLKYQGASARYGGVWSSMAFCHLSS